MILSHISLSAILVTVVTGSLVGAAHAEQDPILTSLVALRKQVRAETKLPIGLIQRITSWQDVPLFSVLDDRESDDPDSYTMTHPLFAFEWSDGRLLVVDAGLSLDLAEEFGAGTKLLGGGDVHCNRDAWRPLLAPGKSIEAIVFTHLHTDHTIGVRELCGTGPVPVQLSPEQEGSDSNYEEQGRELLREESPACVRFEKWRVGTARGPAEPLTGFPGAYRVSVPGHTPGSQLVVGFVRDGSDRSEGSEGAVRGIVIAGDVVNHRLAITRNVAKPWWYRWFIVREDESLQQRFRLLLRALTDAGFEVLVNHDLPGATSGLQSSGCAADPASS